jgi:hypothetical protein
MWFINSGGRDLTSIINSYHSNPNLIRKILEKYQTTIPVVKVLKKDFNVPRFILPPDFDVNRDMLVFDWAKENTMLDQVRRALSSKEMQEKIKRADRMFDIVTALVLIFHLFMAFPGIYY